MIDKIFKAFFVKKGSGIEKITVIKTREVKDFREFRRNVTEIVKIPESQTTCLSGYFNHLKGLYNVNNNEINSLRSQR